MHGIATRVLKTVFPALAALALLFTSCDFSGGTGETERGLTLHISIEDAQAQAQTIVPDLDMDVDRYVVSGTGPDGASFSVETRETAVEVTDLASGEWNITVDALNEDGVIVQQGTEIASLDPGSSRSVRIPIAPLPGYGSVDIDVTWPASDVRDPVIDAKLVPYSGSEIQLDFTVNDSGSAKVVNKTIPAGYYSLILKLYDGDHLVMGTVEVVRVVQDAQTDADFEFSDIATAPGDISVEISPSNYDPIPVEMIESFNELPIKSTRTAQYSAETGGSNIVAVWYINGQEKATGADFQVGSDLTTGNYRLDVAVFTADGKRAGSCGFNFAVTGENREEATLAWDANTESGLAGYKLYYGTSSGSYDKVLDVGKTTTHTVSGLDPDSTYYFAATAYDSKGQESEFSQEVVF